MKRWPFRKRNSLGRLIDRTKQVLDDGTGQDNMQKLAALQVLEKQRQVMRVSSFVQSVSLNLTKSTPLRFFGFAHSTFTHMTFGCVLTNSANSYISNSLNSDTQCNFLRT